MFGKSDDYAFIDSEAYIRKNRRKVIFALAMIIPAVAVAVYSISVTYYTMSFMEAMQAVIDHINGVTPADYRHEILDYLAYELLTPRAIVAVLVGVILAIGGAVMQSSIGNPLADSYTTGISSGALFGVTVAITLNLTLFPDNPELGKVTNAFLFALIPTAVIILFCTKGRSSPMKMILVGIGVMYIFSAATTLLRYTAAPNKAAEIYAWGVGTMAEVTWTAVPVLIVAAIVMVVSMMYLSGRINVLTAGDDMCTALGVHPGHTRIIVLSLVALCTAAAVCFTGSIGFVGLVVPHIARMFVGSNNRYLIPCSAAMGALMLMAADTVARVTGTTGLPVGVITAVVGSPLFLYFLIKQRSSSW